MYEMAHSPSSVSEEGRGHTLHFLGGSPFILAVAQKVYTFLGLVTGQVRKGQGTCFTKPSEKSSNAVQKIILV